MNTTELSILLYQHRNNELEIANIFKTKRKLLLKMAESWPDTDGRCTLLEWAAIRGFHIIVENIIKDLGLFRGTVKSSIWAQVINNGHILCAYQLTPYFDFRSYSIKYGIIIDTILKIRKKPQYVEILNMLLDLDPSLIFNDEGRQYYPMHLSTKLGLQNVVEKFTNLNNINEVFLSGPFAGQTPLITAAESQPDDSSIIEFLLHNGAKVDAKDSKGCTAFMHAIFYQKFNMARTLLKYGANIEEIRRTGRTALIMAAGNGRIQSIQFLLSVGAQPDNKFVSSLMQALRKRQIIAAKYLIRHAYASSYFKEQIKNELLLFVFWEDKMSEYKLSIINEINRKKYNRTVLLLAVRCDLPLEIIQHIHSYVLNLSLVL